MARFPVRVHTACTLVTYSAVAISAGNNPNQFAVPGDMGRGGESTEVNLLIGDNFANNRGNATVFFGWKEDKALTQAEYDFSACSLGRNAAGTGFACGGCPPRSWAASCAGSTGTAKPCC